MRYRILTATVTAAVASLCLVNAQVGPPPPKNLRLAKTTPAPKSTPPSCVVPPVGGAAHAYFDSLVRRSEHYCNWSLRSQEQLNSLVGDPVATIFTYDPAGDDYPDKQDAAKMIRTPGESSSIPGTQQLRMPFKPRIESGSVLITWDWYWGKEFRTNRGAVNHYKMFQVMMDGHGWWTLMANLAWASQTDSNEVSKVSDEFRGKAPAEGVLTKSPWTPAGPGTPDQRPLKSNTTQYPQYHSRWTRYWIEVNMLQPPYAFTDWNQTYLDGRVLGPNPDDPEGRWHMVSLFSADEVRGVQRLLYRVPVDYGGLNKWAPWITTFRLELNTSQPRDSLTGPLIGYARNVVVLHNYKLPNVAEADTYLFQKPIR